MKKLFTLLFATALLVGCGMNKKADECCSADKVKTDPATIGMYVQNDTDKPIYWHRTWGMQAKDVYDTIQPGKDCYYNQTLSHHKVQLLS